MKQWPRIDSIKASIINSVSNFNTIVGVAFAYIKKLQQNHSVFDVTTDEPLPLHKF